MWREPLLSLRCLMWREACMASVWQQCAGNCLRAACPEHSFLAGPARRTKGALPEDEARWLFQQLVIAVEYCHSVGVVNRSGLAPLSCQAGCTQPWPAKAPAPPAA